MQTPFHERKISISAKHRTGKNTNKYDNELKNILRRVKYENINHTVKEVLTNFIGKENKKVQIATNKESIIHDELLKNNFFTVSPTKLKKIRKNSVNSGNNSKEKNKNENQNCFVEKNKTIFNVHKNLNYIYSKYNKNKFFNKVYNPPPVIKNKKSESNNKSVKNTKESNRSRKNFYKDGQYNSSSEGCKFRLFNKKYSSSVEKKNETIKSEVKSPVKELKIKVNTSPSNSNKFVNPLMCSVPLTLKKSEESFFYNYNPEYLKINKNYASSNFSNEKQKSGMIETKNDIKLSIYNRLYDDHFKLKSKHERLVMEMKPSFSPILYKPLKRITFENYFI